MTQKRNYGMDFLRILSMFFILILHTLGQGGVLANSEINSNQYKFTWFMEICAYCAVDVFALISGYVSYNGKEKRVNYANYINLWFQVAFYGVLVTFFYNIIKPELIKKSDYLISLFPVSCGLYWYFTAYTGLFLLMPFLNKCIADCNNEKLKKIFIIVILSFSFFDTIVKRFGLAEGYSVLWIVLLYVLGAIIKKCEIGKNLKFSFSVLGIFFLCLLTWFYKIYGIEIKVSRFTIQKNLFVSYTSPTILGVAILYIIAFSKVQFNEISQNIIKFIAPSTFAIYLLNNQRFVYDYSMKDSFSWLASESLIKIFIYVVGFSIIFFTGSIIIDKIRIKLFKILHINEISNKIENLLNKIISLIAKKI